jgi:hypothetical protein
MPWLCLLAGGYDRVVDIVDEGIQGLIQKENL